MDYRIDALKKNAEELQVRQRLAETQRITDGAYIIYDNGTTRSVRHSGGDDYVPFAEIINGRYPAQPGGVTRDYRTNMLGATGDAAPVFTGPRKGFNV